MLLVGCTIWISYILDDFLSSTSTSCWEGDPDVPLTIILDSCISPLSRTSFCSMYFKVLLFGAYTFRISVFLVNWSFHDHTMAFFVSSNVLCSEVLYLIFIEPLLCFFSFQCLHDISLFVPFYFQLMPLYLNWVSYKQHSCVCV